MAVLGFSLAVTSTSMKSDALLLISSLFAIVFYVMLTYGAAWKVGYSDRSAVRNGDVKESAWRGLFVSLMANIINILLAVGLFIEWAVGRAGATLVRGVAILIQAAYQGLLAYVHIGGDRLNNQWWAYFIIIIPALVASTLGYRAG